MHTDFYIKQCLQSLFLVNVSCIFSYSKRQSRQLLPKVGGLLLDKENEKTRKAKKHQNKNLSLVPNLHVYFHMDCHVHLKQYQSANQNRHEILELLTSSCFGIFGVFLPFLFFCPKKDR